MMGWPAGTSPDIACFSYLASVQTLYVTAYPAADYGSEVLRREWFVAADGPIAAGAAAGLGLRAVLVSNGVADDEAGRGLASLLTSWGVSAARALHATAETPASVVISDADGGRTFFPYLPGVVAHLEQVDLTPLTVAKVAYVDCYEILGVASRRAIDAGLKSGTPVLANLGGSPVPHWLGRTLGGSRLLAIQTSVPETDAGAASHHAADLAALDLAEFVVVTAGMHGAVLRRGRDEIVSSARRVRAQRVQGAGSVFSAAFAHAWLTNARPASMLNFACAAATLWCTLPSTSGPPDLAHVLEFARD
jgi:sugar/nucleoside kinase (ribokinase family)